MEKYDNFKSLIARTNNNVAMNVTGPCKTGKSTFISRITEKFIKPNLIEDGMILANGNKMNIKIGENLADATINLLIITDGTVDGLSRNIPESITVSSPAVVILNTTKSYDRKTRELIAHLENNYDVPVIPCSLKELTFDDMYVIIQELLYEFAPTKVTVNLPQWFDELPQTHKLKRELSETVTKLKQNVKRLRDVDALIDDLADKDAVGDVILHDLDLDTGVVVLEIIVKEEIYYKTLEELTGFKISGANAVFKLLIKLSKEK